MQERAEKTMEEKAVLRVRDRISAALTVPYVRRAVWLMAGGLAGFLTARGLVFGKYAPFAAAGAAAAPVAPVTAAASASNIRIAR